MSAAGLPRLAAPGRLEAALRSDLLDSLGLARISAYLRGRRWFGGKGRTASSARFRDVTPLFPGTAVARLEVDLAGSGPAVYQLPLAVREETEGEPLARVEADGREGLLFDAVEDPTFRERLGECFATGAAFEGDCVRWLVEPVDETGRRAIPAGTAGTLVRAEQSNTSIIYGEHAILKLYRRLERGENPDAEIGAFLATRTSFRNVPRLFGTIRFEDTDGSRTVAGMVQAFVAGSRDGWKYALGVLAEHPPGGTAGEVPFESDAERLGQITRGLHEALASDPSHPDFAPEPVTAKDAGAWRELVRAQALRSLGLLEGAPASGGAPAEGVAILARREEILRRIDSTAGAIGDDAGAKIRHHGDYHLGQVLRDRSGDFLVVDFEGEPARPLAERRRRHCPLRDVAGMLRSFDYAAAAALRAAPAGRGDAEAAGRWSRSVREAFLGAYRGGGAGTFLPRSDPGFRRLLFLFELEKVLYELGYELDNRPDWAPIPLRGLVRLLDAVEEP